MLLGKLYSYFLVFLQVALIFLITIYSFLRNLGILHLSLICLGLALGLWAIISMKGSKLRVTPDVATGAKLIKKGPYKYLRHPMYLSVLIVCLGLFLTNVYSMTIFFYIFLIVVLNLKIVYEERLLRIAFPNYKNYTKKTKKLIPFIY
jgi:protein-S-isoprenylcysteine O-methyltransferase Ste14